MYCPKCGSKLPDGVSTCENCGWSEEAGTANSKVTTKPFPKKVIIAIIAVLVALMAAVGVYMFGATPAKKDDPTTKICGEWKSESAGFDVNNASELQDYDRATAIFNEDGTGSIDPVGDNTKLPWTWKYREDKTEQLNSEALVYEITFKGIEDNSVYVVYKDDGFLLTLPKTSSKELTMYFIRADAE
mgnify:CR=1 FL=1